MLKNGCYDKVKLLHKLSCIAWFIDKHAKEDARKENDAECLALLEGLEKDITKYTEKLHKIICK